MGNTNLLNLLRTNAEKLLSEQFSFPIKLELMEQIEGNHIVCRFRILNVTNLSLDSFIVKKSPIDKKKDETGQSPQNRFLNELASLSFLDSLSNGVKVSPKLIAHDLSQGIVILEDLGKHDTIADLLHGDDGNLAIEGLENMIKQFAKLHWITIHKQIEFE